MRTVLVSAVISGLVVGVSVGFAWDGWIDDGGQETSITPGNFTPPNGFPGGGNLNPADFIGLANAEGGAAALESFISSGFGAGGPDPDFLRERLRGFGIQVDDDATTAEMLEMVANTAETIFPAPVE